MSRSIVTDSSLVKHVGLYRMNVVTNTGETRSGPFVTLCGRQLWMFGIGSNPVDCPECAEAAKREAKDASGLSSREEAMDAWKGDADLDKDRAEIAKGEPEP